MPNFYLGTTEIHLLCLSGLVKHTASFILVPDTGPLYKIPREQPPHQEIKATCCSRPLARRHVCATGHTWLNQRWDRTQILHLNIPKLGLDVSNRVICGGRAQAPCGWCSELLPNPESCSSEPLTDPLPWKIPLHSTCKEIDNFHLRSLLII